MPRTTTQPVKPFNITLSANDITALNRLTELFRARSRSQVIVDLIWDEMARQEKNLKKSRTTA